MPLQQLRLYDILVDIFPGVVFFSLIYPLLSGNPLNTIFGSLASGASLAVILIALGYAIGRILHYISGTVDNILKNPFGLILATIALELNMLIATIQLLKLKNPNKSLVAALSAEIGFSIGSNIWITLSSVATGIFFSYIFLSAFKEITYQALFSENPLTEYSDIKNLLAFFPVEHPEEYIDEWFKKGNTTITDPQNTVSGPIEANISSQLREKLKEEYGFDLAQTGLPHAERDSEWIRYIGYSRLFSTQNLYQRYNTLSTFFRNMSLAFWLPYLIYSVLNIYTMMKPDHSWSSGPLSTDPQFRYLITFSLLVVAVLFSLQLSKYSKYRNRQFIIDFLESIK